MKYATALVLLLTLLVLPASAQTFETETLTGSAAPVADKADGAPSVRHVTHELMQWPEARRAAEEFLALKQQGWQPTASKTTVQVGDTLAFKVANLESNQVEQYDFRLMAESETFYVWAQLTEIDNGHIDAEVVAGLTEALGAKTPAGSYNPNAGIIINNETVFGEPPNIDGDGKTDVLLVDIQDGFSGSGGFVAGFVTTLDLGGAGNRRDVLYLDSYPGLTGSRGIEEVALTAAHEYQHLIHFEYDLNELSFVNEGLSEWAEVVNGYQARTISYLADPGRYNVNLLRWSGNLSDLVFDDYQRGGLFTNYIADRIGALETGAITRQSFDGGDGYTRALEGTGLSLTDLLVDFHIANLLNDTSNDVRYGYSTSQRQGLRATPSLQADGRTASETPTATLSVRPGAAQFLVWDDVTDFALTLELTRGTAEQVQPRLLLFQDQSFTEQSLEFSANPQVFTGRYDRIALVIPHIDLTSSENVQVRYGATWSSSVSYTSEVIQYDNGQAGTPSGDNPFFSLGAGTTGAVATRFDVPAENAILDKVFVAPYFLSQFSNGGQPADAPRNITLKIWTADAEGEPEAEILSLELADPRAGGASTALNPFEVDLSGYAEQLTGLAGPILVGYTNAGSDQNYLVVGVSPSSADHDVSVIGNTGTGNWIPLWDVQFQGGDPEEFPVRQTVIPIRASFLVPNQPVAGEEVDELPERLALYPNYPNPFNPATTIRYAVPATGTVTLKVFDVLGREVATLIDGVQAAGEHTVSLDASRWASGVYFYTVKAGGQQQTRQMLLVK